MKFQKIEPHNDGIDHINIYSKSQSILGRMLSNFSDHSIQTVDGLFLSVEGYWYWLGCRDDRLQKAVGYEAKKLGRELGCDDYPRDPMFKLKICAALLNKLISHPEIYEMFKENKLPFKHYYEYNGRVVEPQNGKWITEFWNFIQQHLI